jgi:subtilisin family serine protease
MNKRYLFILAAVWISALFLISTVLAESKASKIDSYLQEILNSKSKNEMVPVYIMLDERLSLEYLQSMTKGLNKKERRKEVVRILKEYAASTQKNVLSYLENAKSQGKIDRLENIWSINVIAFQAKPAVVYDLARDYAEIEQIKYDRPISREEATDDLGISKYNEENNIVLGPTYAPQQGLILINAPAVWAEGDSGQGVIVANVDGGTDWRHPDLIHNIWNNLGEDVNGNGKTIIQSGASWVFDPGDVNGVDDDGNGKVDDFIGWNFSDNGNDPSTASISHGTSTAGIVAGDGTNGTATGVAPRAKLMNLNINTAGESDWWAAYQYAFEMGADVTTSSFSAKWGFSPQPNYPMFRQTADMELAAGTVHTNSTSNDGNSYGPPFNISAPGCVPGPWMHPDQTLVGGISSVIGSANVDAFSDLVVSSSPWGPFAWEDYQINHPTYPFTMPLAYQDYPYEAIPGSMGLIKPDVAAPGNSTTSIAPGGGYSSFGGTSGATPHLAGVAALILSANPDLEPVDVSRIMQTTAVEKGDPGKDNRYGAGRVDAYAAYLQAFAEAGSPAPPTDFSVYSDYSMETSMLLNWTNPTSLLNGNPLTSDAFSIVIHRDGIYVDSIPGANNDYLDTGLNDGQEYLYQIYAVVDSSGKASESISASWIAGGSPVPNPPTNFGLSGSQNEVIISWVSPTTNIDATPIDDYAGINVYKNGVLETTFTRTSADTGITDSDTFTVTPAGYYDWYITVIDNESPVNESDPTNSLGTPLSVPIEDFFETAGTPNPGIWINSGAEVNDRADTPPSPPYALNLNGHPVGEDVVELKAIDLSGMAGSGIVFSYSYQPQGNGNAPEEGDSLRVYFKNDLDNWVLVRAYPGTVNQPFSEEVIDIANAPNGGGSYFHGQFQVRFRSTGSAGTFPNDDWFIDNIFLGTTVGIVGVEELPQSYEIKQNYPNPFNPSTTIEYGLPRGEEVRLVIYNTLGQQVRRLLNQKIEAGKHRVEWDGRNDMGKSVASGVYIYRFEAGNFHRIQKMMLLK